MDGVDKRPDMVDGGSGKHAVAEVEDVARTAVGLREDRRRPPRISAGGAKQRRRVEVPLDRDVVADPPPGLASSTRQSSPITSPPASRERLQQGRRPGPEVDHGHARRERLQDGAGVRQDERAIVVRPERAHPGVEELDGLGARGDLRVQVARRGPREEGAAARARPPGRRT